MDRLLALQEVAAEKSLRDNGIPEFVPAFLWLDPDPEKTCNVFSRGTMQILEMQ